jgi:hypothetical protein
MNLHPYRQGALDSLCGIYAVINATRLAAWPAERLTKRDCHDLFKALASVLDADGRLLQVLTEGSFYPTLSRLLRVADRWLEAEFDLRIRFTRPYHLSHPARSAEILRQLARHLGTAQTAAIMCLRECSAEHWTVAGSVTRSRSLRLFDSGRRRIVPPGLPQLRDSSAPRLIPRDLYLIWTSS